MKAVPWESIGFVMWRRYVGAVAARLRAGFLAWTGRTEAAEAALKRAAILAPGSFAAQVAHGRVLLTLGREAEALEALGRARLIAPERFLRRREIPASLRELVAVSRAAADLPLPSIAEPKGAVVGAAKSPTTERNADDRPDFAGGGEARRFQGLRPIDMTSAKNVDWDELLRKLSDPTPSGGRGDA